MRRSFSKSSCGTVPSSSAFMITGVRGRRPASQPLLSTGCDVGTVWLMKPELPDSVKEHRRETPARRTLRDEHARRVLLHPSLDVARAPAFTVATELHGDWHGQWQSRQREMESLGAHHDLRLPSGAGLEIDGSHAVGHTELALVPEAVLSRRPPARPGAGTP